MNVWALYEAYDLHILRLSEVWIDHLAWHPSCSGHVRRAFIPSSPLSNLLFRNVIYIQSPFQIFNEFNLHFGISTNQPPFQKSMGFIVMTQSSSRITPYFSIHLSFCYIFIYVCSCYFRLVQTLLAFAFFSNTIQERNEETKIQYRVMFKAKESTTA